MNTKLIVQILALVAFVQQAAATMDCTGLQSFASGDAKLIAESGLTLESTRSADNFEVIYYCKDCKGLVDARTNKVTVVDSTNNKKVFEGTLELTNADSTDGPYVKGVLLKGTKFTPATKIVDGQTVEYFEEYGVVGLFRCVLR